MSYWQNATSVRKQEILTRQLVLYKQKLKVRFSTAWFRKRFTKLVRNARDRGLIVEINFDQFKELRQHEECVYCGITDGVFTIDRIDNNVGYTLENCKLACFRCNKVKSDDFSFYEMKLLGKTLQEIDELRTL